MCVEKSSHCFFWFYKRLEMTKTICTYLFVAFWGVHHGQPRGVTKASFTTLFFDPLKRRALPLRVEQTNSHQIWL